MHVNHYFPRFLVIHKKCLDGIGTSGINTSTTCNSTCCQKPFSSSCSSCSKHYFPLSPTTRSWCEITRQDQASVHQVKKRCRRGIRYEQPSCHESSFLTTDIFMCHVHHRWIGCLDCTDSQRIRAVPERWSDPPGKHLQATALVLHCSEWRPKAAVNMMVHRGCSCPTGTGMNRNSVASRGWCVTVGHKAQFPSATQFLLHKLLYFTIAWNALITIQSPGLFRFCWLLDFLTSFFLQNKTLSPSLGLWTSISLSWKKVSKRYHLNIFSYLIRYSNATALNSVKHNLIITYIL